MFFDMPQKGVELYKKAEQVLPGTEVAAQALRQAALTLHQQGKLAEAKKVYDKIVTDYSKFIPLKEEAQLLSQLLEQEIIRVGPEIAPPPPPELKIPAFVRVALALNANTVKISAPNVLRVTTFVRSFTAQAPITVRRSGSSVLIEGLNFVADQLLIEPQGAVNSKSGAIKGISISIDGRSSVIYRGSVHIKPSQAGMIVVNLVGLEEYLYGVINSEMPSSFGLEALKVQAVAARTYVLYKIYHESKEDYDVLSTIKDQVYMGVSRETDVGRLAVDKTRGMILISAKRPILAYFSASNGGIMGHPSEISNDFYGSFSYFRVGTDPHDCFPAWRGKTSKSRLEARLAANGINVGTITNIKVVSTSASGRVRKLALEGTNGRVELPASRFKYIVGDLNYDTGQSGNAIQPQLLLSYLITSISISGDEVIFFGRGFGHGVGMSQYGAYCRSKNANQNFRQVLDTYYPGAELVQLR